MKRYIIYAPIWHHRSAGLMVLYNLQKSLIKRGYDCIYYCFGSEHVAIDEVTDDDIVIYTEIVNGNPLKAKNVVRWLLNIPGVIGGNGNYLETDMVFFYMDRKKYSNMKGLPLHISISRDDFKDLGLPKEHNLIWVYKGANKKRIPLDGIEITFDWPKSKDKLIDLLQRCKIFYSYDEHTSLAAEAKMCGCDVRLVNADGSIVPFPLPDLTKITLDDEKQLDDFIRITQGEISYDDFFKTSVLTDGEQLLDLRDKNELISSRAISPKLTSIIILCLNQIEYTKRCLESIEQYTSVPYELIIVDNGSTDGTPDFLEEYSRLHNDCKIILNKKNLGFAGGNNQGIAAARGDYILLLNNDVVVTEHWLERLVKHIESHINIGMIGPVTNYCPGPQLIENTGYDNNLKKMHAFAREYTEKNAGKIIEILRPLGFCLLIKRHVLDIIGVLDEGYGIGNYEDDDLCLRSRIAGFRNVITYDVFIHHYGSMTFKGNSIDYDTILQNNRKRFIDKWKGVVEEVDDLIYRFVMSREEQINKLNEWGEEKFSEENFHSALKIFERVLQFDPKNSQALNNIGVMQWQLGDPVEALTTFQNALINNPKDTDALENLTQATIETGEFNLINPDLLEMLKNSQPENPHLGILLKEQYSSSPI